MDCMLFPAQENNQKENSTHLHEMAVQQTMVRTFSCARKNGMVCISSYRISDSTDCQIVKINVGQYHVHHSVRIAPGHYALLRMLSGYIVVTCSNIFNPFEMLHFCLHAFALLLRSNNVPPVFQ